MGLYKSAEPKEVTCLFTCIQGERHEMLTDGRREFEPMSRETRSDHDIWPLGMTVENEMPIRSARIEAYAALQYVWRDTFQEP
jgi:hypothetical protein